MDGVIIADATCRPILSSRLSRTTAAAFLEPLQAALARADASGTDPEPIIWLPGLLALAADPSSPTDEGSSDDSDSDAADGYEDVDGARAWGGRARSSTTAVQTGGSACCHILRGDVRLIAIVTREVDPTVPFAFLDAFAALLAEYFGSVSEHVVKDNFDTVLQLLDEALAPPHPILTDPTTLKELVPTPSALAKLLSVATAALGNASGPQRDGPIQSLLTSPLPWRKQGIRHKNNEIYFDIVEEVSAIVDRTGKLVTSEIWGSIECRCKLSGMPDLLMLLSTPGQLEDCSFHPCVRLAKWHANKSLSFVPPDGRFTLMSYRLGPPPTSSAPNASGGNHGLPIALKPTVTLGTAGGAFSFVLQSRLSPSFTLEDVVVVFKLGAHASDVAASVTGGPRVDGGGASSSGEAPMRWEYDASARTLRWKLARLTASDRPAVLSGTWLSSVPHERPALSVQVAFSAPLTNLSGLRVTSLKLHSDSSSPYKGVRPMLRSGSLDFRW